MGLTMRVVWRCKCGKLLASEVRPARCPQCLSAFQRTEDGRVIITAGSWEVLNVND